ncbi:hypothetical protein Tco_1412569 [Tanacetum coccineum]
MPSTRSGASMTREEFEELVARRSKNGGNGNGNEGNGNGNYEDMEKGNVKWRKWKQKWKSCQTLDAITYCLTKLRTRKTRDMPSQGVLRIREGWKVTQGITVDSNCHSRGKILVGRMEARAYNTLGTMKERDMLEIHYPTATSAVADSEPWKPARNQKCKQDMETRLEELKQTARSYAMVERNKP